MPQLPPDSAVHLKEWNFASVADCRNAGYRKVGNEYVRIDLAERVIKKAHEARGQGLEFALDMTFATSLGLSEEGLNALMRDAGFRRMESPGNVAAEVTDDHAEAPPADDIVVETVAELAPEPVELRPETVVENDSATPAQAPTEIAVQPASLTHWRWIGLRKPKPREQQQHRPKTGKPQHKPKGHGNSTRKSQSSMSKPTTAPSALALQLAALKEKMGN